MTERLLCSDSSIRQDENFCDFCDLYGRMKISVISVISVGPNKNNKFIATVITSVLGLINSLA